MFDKDRFVTRGVNERIPVELQMYMWNQIDNMDVKSKDYLQIFNLYPATSGFYDCCQGVCHTQEQPYYTSTSFFSVDYSKVTAKVYVIDDFTHSTMLLSDEY